MNTVVSQFTVLGQDVPLAQGMINARPQTGVSPAFLEDFIHELRQPLGVIETLAYYMELTTTDENLPPRLQHMQAMLAKVNQLFESAMQRNDAGR